MKKQPKLIQPNHKPSFLIKLIYLLTSLFVPMIGYFLCKKLRKTGSNILNNACVVLASVNIAAIIGILVVLGGVRAFKQENIHNFSVDSEYITSTNHNIESNASINNSHQEDITHNESDVQAENVIQTENVIPESSEPIIENRPTENKPIENITPETEQDHLVDNPIESQNPTKQKINLANYSYLDKYNGLTDRQIEIIKTIKDAYQNPTKYEYGKWGTHDNCIKLWLEPKISEKDFKIINSYFAVYVGNSEFCDSSFVLENYLSDEVSLFVIQRDIMQQYISQRDKNMKTVENILSTFNEGTEYEKLMQIVQYVNSHYEYNLNNKNLPELLNSNTGNCNALGEFFTMAARRLGIDVDMCYNYGQGRDHTWNRVRYKDGTIRYYDMTYVVANPIENTRLVDCITPPYEITNINYYYTS